MNISCKYYIHATMWLESRYEHDKYWRIVIQWLSEVYKESHIFKATDQRIVHRTSTLWTISITLTTTAQIISYDKSYDAHRS